MTTRPFVQLIGLLALFALPLSLFSQDQSDSTIAEGRKHVLAFTPLRLILPTQIGPEFIYQKILSDQRSIQIKAGYVYAHQAGDLTWSSHGGRLGIEFKRFRGRELGLDNSEFRKRGTSSSGGYVGIELDAMYVRRPGSISITRAPDSRHETTTKYTFTTQSSYLGSNFKLGYQKIAGRFFFDAFIGLGLRLIHSSFDGISGGEHKVIREELWGYSSVDWGFNPLAFYEKVPLSGTYWGVSIPLNVRVGFAF